MSCIVYVEYHRKIVSYPTNILIGVNSYVQQNEKKVQRKNVYFISSYDIWIDKDMFEICTATGCRCTQTHTHNAQPTKVCSDKDNSSSVIECYKP